MAYRSLPRTYACFLYNCLCPYHSVVIRLWLPIICMHVYTGLRASMNPASNPLVGAPQAPGVYPGAPVGQWGAHPVPHGQVAYSAPAIPGGVAPFPVVAPSAPSYSTPSKSSKQNKSQVRRCSEKPLSQTSQGILLEFIGSQVELGTKEQREDD